LSEDIFALQRYGTGYKKIRKALNVPRDTVGSIVHNSGYTTWTGQKKAAINGCNQMMKTVMLRNVFVKAIIIFLGFFEHKVHKNSTYLK